MDQNLKCDPNTEVFQSRAQLKKAENCKKQWHIQWSWLLEEKKKEKEECQALTRKLGSVLLARPETPRRPSMKPIPPTTNGMYGWLAQKEDCALEVYVSWLTHIPLKAPDAWQYPEYFEKLHDR